MFVTMLQPACLLFLVAVVIECSTVTEPPLFAPGKLPSDGSVNVKGMTQGNGETKEAYVTLLYGGFLLGARVLGKSLQNTGTKKDLIALCTETVSAETKAVLKADGWIIKPISNIRNPYKDMSTRGTHLFGAYSKLFMWNMTDFERIVYLDSDVLVLSNIDHLFDCGTFCAAYRHSDLFNTGVLVIEPSASIFNDMMKKLAVLPSYTHGDQGFLNVYFNNLMYASMFNWSNSTRQQQQMRLPAGLNGDIGMYYIDSNKWSIQTEELRIIHYTLGPVKPWIWWANYLFDLNQLWIDVRMQLPDVENSCSTKSLLSLIFWAPYPLASLSFIFMIIFFKSTCQWPFAARALKFFAFLSNRFSHFLQLPILFLSYYLTFHYIVPTTMVPNQAEYVFFLWSNFFLLIFFGTYCFLCHIASKQNSSFIPRKSRLSLLLYAVFVSSCVLLKVVPSMVTPLSWRFLTVLLFLGIHLVVSHKCGQYLIYIWTGSSTRISPIHQRYRPAIMHTDS